MNDSSGGSSSSSSTSAKYMVARDIKELVKALSFTSPLNASIAVSLKYSPLNPFGTLIF